MFEVTIVQEHKSSYYDEEKGKVVEFNTDEELNATFNSWEDVQVLTNLVLDNFKGVTVKIRVNRKECE